MLNTALRAGKKESFPLPSKITFLYL